VDQQRYLPYGQPRLPTGTSPTDRLFTGQRNLSSLGLMDYKARFYSPTLGRFIQPDTIVPDQTNPQAFNRFSYVANNPVNFNDPSGHYECNNIYGCSGPNDDSDVDIVGSSGGGDPWWEIGDGPITFTPLPGWTFNSQPTVNNYIQSLISPFTDRLCYQMLNVPCDALSGITFPSFVNSPNLPSSNSVSTSPYNLNAIGFGVGAIAGFFPAQGTGGIDAIYIADENAISFYGYNGTAVGSAGGGGTAGAYIIIGANIHNSADYAGVSQAVNITGAYGYYGATVTYFWSGNVPLEPSAPQGITIWYSPGLGANAAYSNVNYTPWGIVSLH
jgi:RHS repeat-associated protein